MIARNLIRFVICLALSGAALPAAAHHGLMLWDESVTTIEGFISEEMDGFPHWEISVRTPDGEDWEVDMGSDFEMERAGLKPDDLPVGTKVKVEGNRPQDSDERLLRPMRIIAGERVFEFKGKWN